MTSLTIYERRDATKIIAMNLPGIRTIARSICATDKMEIVGLVLTGLSSQLFRICADWNCFTQRAVAGISV